MSESGEYLYDAFISYRHSELDKAVAQKLHRLLENYRIPAGIRKQTGIGKIKRVFRDQEELPTSSNLSSDIQNALLHSRFLIVICSKNTPSSRWCAEEIETFRQMHGGERILSLLVDGEPDESFPSALRFHTYRRETDDGRVLEETREIEPLAADIRGASLKQMLKKLKLEKLRLLAPILGVGFDDLRQRHREQFIRKTISLVLTASFVLASFGSYSLYQLNVIAAKNRELARQTKQAEDNEALAIEQKNNVLKSQSLYLANLSGQQLKNGDRYNALLLALEALPEDPDNPDRPYVPEAEVALRNAFFGCGRGDYTSNMTFQSTSQVSLIRFSHDGKLMATGSYSGYPILWDVESGEKRAILNATDSARSIAFNGDDSRVMVLSALYFVSVWDTAAGKELFKIADHDMQVINAAAYTPDYQHIITGSKYGISTWDAQTGQKLSEYQTDGEVQHLAISSDGALMAYVTDGVTIRNSTTGNEIRLENVSGGYPANIEFSQDGKKLLVYSTDESLPGIWDTATGTKLSAPDYPASAHIVSSDISTSGGRAVTSYDDNHTIVWDTGTGKVLAERTESADTVMFGADDQTILSGGASGTRLWNSAASEHDIDVLDGKAPAMASSGLIATASGDLVRLWAAGNVQTYDGTYSDRRLCFNSVGSRFAAALWEDNTVSIRDAASGQELIKLSGHSQPILDIAYSPDDSMIAATGQDGQAIVWDAETGEVLYTLQCGAADSYIWSARFSADSGRLVTTGNHQLIVWDLKTGTEMWRTTDGLDYNEAIFSQDGATLLVTAFDGGCYALDAATGQSLFTYAQPETYIDEASYNKDSSRIIVRDFNNAELWDATSNMLICKLNADGEDINSAQFSKDGTKLVTTSDKNKVVVRDARSGEIEKQLDGFGKETTYAEFSPDGSKLLIATEGISVWDLQTGMEYTHIGTDGFVYQAIHFSPDNERIFSRYPFLVSWRLGTLQETMTAAQDILQGRALSDEAKKKFYIS